MNFKKLVPLRTLGFNDECRTCSETLVLQCVAFYIEAEASALWRIHDTKTRSGWPV
jgi:hypothetical protein